MIKTLAAANKSERETFKIPRSVQQSIPIQRVFRDGIWQMAAISTAGHGDSRILTILWRPMRTSRKCFWPTAVF